MTSVHKERHQIEEKFLRHGHGQGLLTGDSRFDQCGNLQSPVPKSVAGTTVLNTIQTWERFCALSIKVDTAAGDAVPRQVDAVLLQLIDAAQHEHRAVGCRWAEGLYICALMDNDIEKARAFAKQLQNQLGCLRPETVSIGIAVYPQLTFSRGQCLINTCKALDHASFFGPGSVVSFDATSLNISGDKLYHAGQLDLAAGEYRTGLEINPYEANLHNSLGICQAEKGGLTAAVASFKSALEIDPDDAMAKYNLGMVALLKQDPEQALDCFREAYALNRKIYEIPFQIGKLLYGQGNWQAALEYLDEAIALNHRIWRLFSLKGGCLARSGATSKAIQAYSRSVKLNPNDAEGLSALGCLYDACGENPEICETFFQQSIKLNPRNGLFYHRLGRWRQKHRQADLAMEAYLQASALGYDASQEMAELSRTNEDEEDPTVRCA